MDRHPSRPFEGSDGGRVDVVHAHLRELGLRSHAPLQIDTVEYVGVLGPVEQALFGDSLAARVQRREEDGWCFCETGKVDGGDGPRGVRVCILDVCPPEDD